MDFHHNKIRNHVNYQTHREIEIKIFKFERDKAKKFRIMNMYGYENL